MNDDLETALSATRLCTTEPPHGRMTLFLGQLAEHGDHFNLDQQLRAAEFRLNAGGGGQRVQSLLLVECCALLVKLRVVAINVAQITTGAHNILPRNSLGREQGGNVLEEDRVAVRDKMLDVLNRRNYLRNLLRDVEEVLE